MRLSLASRTWKISCRTSGKNGPAPRVRANRTSGKTWNSNEANILYIPPDPDNLLTMLQTWQLSDVSKQEPYNGNFEAAMASIKAKTLVLPGKTDLYFP